MTITCRAADCAAKSDPDLNRAFRGGHRASLPRDAAALNRLAEAELSAGNFRFADRLSWLAEGCLDGAP